MLHGTSITPAGAVLIHMHDLLSVAMSRHEQALLQAGTLSGNPLAMTAGLKTLEILDRPGTYEHLEKITGRLIEGILQAGRDAGHAVSGGHISGESVSEHDLISVCLLVRRLRLRKMSQMWHLQS